MNEILVIADGDGDVAATRDMSGDFAVGSDSTFSVTLDDGLRVEEGWYLYIDGTEFGGVVDGYEIDTGKPGTTWKGRTWPGILAENFLLPDAGDDYLTVDGEANAVLGALVERMGLGGVFAASEDDSGIEVSYSFPREGSALDGIEGMLGAVGAKLRMRRMRGRTVLSAVPAEDYARDGADSDRLRLTIKKDRPVNHLVCMGAGELAERAVVHLYADRDGNVGTVQTIFGAEHRAELYDSPSADAAELAEAGAERLRGMQGGEEIRVTDTGAGSYDVGDVLGGRDNARGVRVSAKVTKKIGKVSPRGLEVQTEAGEPTIS